jgi:hypothetical protein
MSLSLYQDIFNNLGDLALSDALLEDNAHLTLRKIQDHLVRCATTDGFSEFYDYHDISEDKAIKIEQDCVNIARTLYVNPLWLYNGPEADTKHNKQKIIEAIKECIPSSELNDDDKEEIQHDDVCDGTGHQSTTDEEEDEDEGYEEIEHMDDVGKCECESEEFSVHEDTEGTEEGTEEDEEESGEKSKEEEDPTDEVQLQLDDDLTNDTSSEELSLNDGKIIATEEDSGSVISHDWVDDMDLEEVLRIDRCYMNIDNEIIKDFDFFK